MSTRRFPAFANGQSCDTKNLSGDPAVPVRHGDQGPGGGRLDVVCTGGGREAVWARPRLSPGSRGRAGPVDRRVAAVPNRPLPGKDGPRRDLVHALHEHDPRAAVEPQLRVVFKEPPEIAIGFGLDHAAASRCYPPVHRTSREAGGRPPPMSWSRLPVAGRAPGSSSVGRRGRRSPSPQLAGRLVACSACYRRDRVGGSAGGHRTLSPAHPARRHPPRHRHLFGLVSSGMLPPRPTELKRDCM
jgi:hypothetical protein